MTDDRAVLERVVRGFAPPEDPFERLLQRRDRKKRNQRLAAGAVGVIAALAAALAGATLLRSAPVPSHEDPLPAPTARNGDIVLVRGLFWTSGTDPEIVAVDPGTGAVRRLVTCDQECFVSPDPWSPGGTRLLYSSGGTSYTLDMESGSTRHVVQGRSVNGIVSPDGERIVYDAGMPPTTPSRFFVSRSDGSEPEHLPALDGLNLWWYQWSPDGRSIVYFEHGVHVSSGSIGIVELDDPSNARTFVSFPDEDPCNPPAAGFGGLPLGCVHSVVMSPADGRIAYATFDPAAGVDEIRIVDPRSGDVATVATWAATGISGVTPSRMAWSPDGSRIAYAAGCRIWSIAPDGSDRTVIGDPGACTVRPDRLTWSPDGRELAFYEIAPATSQTFAEATLTILTLEGGGVRRLGTFEADDSVGLQPFVWQPLPWDEGP
jgi:Tol biopolymer transport system component